MESKAYTLGKGELYFDKFDTNGDNTGERYLGNTPEFNLTIESENLDHFDSDQGIRTKDDSVVLEVIRTASLITDNINKENAALFLTGDISTVTQVATPVVDESILNVTKGFFYQLGKTLANPQGVRGVTAVTVTKAPSTALVLNTDYTLDATLGRIQLLETGVTLVANDDLLIDYTPVANTRERIATNASATLEGSLRFIAKNPKGTQRDFYFPKVTLRPAGDFALKGDDWQQLPFSVEIGQNEGQSAIYVDGRPSA